jgi:hypothetical protein
MKWIRNNSLSLVFIVLFFLALTGQIFTGFKEHNKERKEDGYRSINEGIPSFGAFLTGNI